MDAINTLGTLATGPATSDHLEAPQVAQARKVFREVLSGWFADLLEARRSGVLEYSWMQERGEELWHSAAA